MTGKVGPRCLIRTGDRGYVGPVHANGGPDCRISPHRPFGTPRQSQASWSPRLVEAPLVPAGASRTTSWLTPSTFVLRASCPHPVHLDLGWRECTRRRGDPKPKPLWEGGRASHKLQPGTPLGFWLGLMRSRVIVHCCATCEKLCSNAMYKKDAKLRCAGMALCKLCNNVTWSIDADFLMLT